MKKSAIRFWLGILISLFFVIFLLQGTDLRKLADAFKRADYIYCLPMVALVLLGMVIRAYRWRDIMRPLHKAAIANLFSATMIGFMANFVLPARMGEFIRAYLIGKKENLSKSAAFATIIVERLCDTFSIILILAMVLFFISSPESGLGQNVRTHLANAGITLCILFLFLLTVLIFLKQKTQVTVSVMLILFRPFPKNWGQRVADIMQSFTSGLGAVTIGRHLLAIVVFSLLLWGITGLGNELLLRAFDIQLPFYVAYYILVLQAVGVAVPSSPGFVGTYHAAVVFGMTPFTNVSHEEALSFALLSHFLLIVPIILCGLVIVWKEHLSLRFLETEVDQRS